MAKESTLQCKNTQCSSISRNFHSLRQPKTTYKNIVANLILAPKNWRMTASPISLIGSATTTICQTTTALACWLMKFSHFTCGRYLRRWMNSFTARSWLIQSSSVNVWMNLAGPRKLRAKISRLKRNQAWKSAWKRSNFASQTTPSTRLKYVMNLLLFSWSKRGMLSLT